MYHKLMFSLFVGILFASCKDKSPQPSDLVGEYTVTLKLNDATKDKEIIKDSIKIALNEAKKEIQAAKDEMKQDLDLSNIDTSTAEGKIEYLATSFGKSMADVGLNVGEDVTGLLGELTGQGIDFSESLLSKVSIDVHLQADGDVKTSGSLLTLSFRDATWKTEGDKFILKQSGESNDEVFIIKDKNDKGFTLEKDKLLILFNKKV